MSIFVHFRGKKQSQSISIRQAQDRFDSLWLETRNTQMKKSLISARTTEFHKDTVNNRSGY